MTPDEVLQAKFRSTKFRDGYDQDEVDDYLDRVVELLRARLDGRPSSVAPETLADPRFTATKFREGYEVADVDDLIARLQPDLAAAAPTGGFSRGPAPAAPFSPTSSPAMPFSAAPDGSLPGPAGPSDEPVPGLITRRRRWWQRLG